MNYVNKNIFFLALLFQSMNLMAEIVPAVSCSGFEINQNGTFNEQAYSHYFESIYHAPNAFKMSELYRTANGIDTIRKNTLVDFLKVPRAGYSRIKSFTYDTATAIAPSYKYNGTIAAGLYDNLLAYSQLYKNLVKVSGNIKHSLYLETSDLVDVSLAGNNNSAITCHRKLPLTAQYEQLPDQNGVLVSFINDGGAKEIAGSWQNSRALNLRSPESMESFWCEIKGNMKDLASNLFKVLNVVHNEGIPAKDTFLYPDSKIRTGDDREVLTDNGYILDKKELESRYGKYEGMAITQTSCGVALLCNESNCTLERYNGATIVPSDSKDRDTYRNIY
jgi:hypothetical protein